ncbi:unnamed protein product [Cuscuta europaea]|uniref:BAR domain-containing protein n=2 Tax=Cuscuta europaea TaxID=41803 RepID=A0A9P0Z120_CUSEU|nr:unnamed protein product [Cuscuta europaea]
MLEGVAHLPGSLDDSPMFRQQMQSMEENVEVLKEKCLKFCKACRKYTEGLVEAYDRDVSFASALEIFGGVHDDPTSVVFGGPDMVNCAIALREIGTYKETLQSQVEDVLIDRLQHFTVVELPHVKYAERRFVYKVKNTADMLSVAEQLWEGVLTNDKKTVYRLIVVYGVDVNAINGHSSPGKALTLALSLKLDSKSSCAFDHPRQGSEDNKILDGCSLIHLACQIADIAMVELLLQHGANINACDSRGQTPLHHSVIRGRVMIAKLLLSRYTFESY